jgi:hypothetical protein
MTACVVHDDSMSCFATAFSEIDSMFKWTCMLSEYGVKSSIMLELRAMLILLVNFMTYHTKLQQQLAATEHAVRVII